MKLRNLFLYAGLTKEGYDSIKPLVREGNRKNLCLYTILTAFLLLLMYAFGKLEPSLMKYRHIYLVVTFLSLGSYLLARFGRGNAVDASMYLFTLSVFYLGIAEGTLIDPNNVTSIYLSLIFAVPLLFTDRPIKMDGALLLSAAVYFVLAYRTQTREYLIYNITNILPVGFLSLVASTYMMTIKADRLTVRRQNEYLLNSMKPMDRSVGKASLDSIVNLVQVMMTFHSDESLLHCKRVKEYAKLLCNAYNELHRDKPIPRENIEQISIGAQLHDIGKIYIPDEILHKKEALTDAEMETIRNHTVIGARLIDYVAEICGVDSPIMHNIVLYHHERWDGSGYPEKLKEEQIPLEAHLVGLAEVYDALTANNYSEARSHDETIAMIRDGKCGAFNPELLDCLKYAEPGFRTLLDENKDEERVDLLGRVMNHHSKAYWYFKRAFDIVASLAGLIILSPIFLAVALWIKLDDPKSPVIFKQTRLGRHKKPFQMYKFRTMVPNAEALLKELQAENEKDGPVFKIKEDPRITKPGRFLRKTSLDELPQLVNILKGEMSVVGPRPPLPSEVEKYSRYHEMRLSVTPGLTCLWQASEARDDVPFEKWMDMDVAYIGTRGMRTDIKIILKTVMCVLKGSGH